MGKKRRHFQVLGLFCPLVKQNGSWKTLGGGEEEIVCCNYPDLGW